MLYNFTQAQLPVPTFSLLSKNPEEKRSCVLSLSPLSGAEHVKIVSATSYNSVWATPERALMCMRQSISPGFQNNVKVKLRVLTAKVCFFLFQCSSACNSMFTSTLKECYTCNRSNIYE